MNLVPEWAPNVHPMFVHFPIGLLMTAVALDLLALLPRMNPIRRAVPIFYAAGAVAAIATYFTGQAGADGLSISAAAEPILTEHADYALWTVLFFSAYAVVRLVAAKILTGANLAVRGLFVVAAGFGLYLIWETAEHGSEMVYAYGVGVQQAPVVQVGGVRGADAGADAAGRRSALHIHDDGWSLEATGSLAHSDIRWLAGNPQSAATFDSAVVITLEGDPAMFVITDTLADVQLIAELDLSAFSGTVWLVHHVQDSSTYDFLQISEGEMRLGRVQEGAVRTFDQASAAATGSSSVRVTGDGTHFRGYVDDQMVVHGHADPLPAGTAGLRLEGEGTLQVRRLQARVL